MEHVRQYESSGWFLRSQRRGFTLIELLAAIFVIVVPIITMQIALPRFGFRSAVEAAVISAIVSVNLVIVFYKASSRQFEKEQRELLKKYPDVYRVSYLPQDSSSVLKDEWTIIAVGDYGWEAEPIHKDGLRYLHGLTKEWQVAWYAGFREDQIERIGPKPRSQYHLPYSYNCNPPPCPFPITTLPEATLGMPSPIFHEWVQGKYLPNKQTEQ